VKGPSLDEMAPTPQPNLLEDKGALRRAMAQRREAVAPGERRRLSGAASARLVALPQLADVAGKTVAAYVAIPGKGEIDPAAALADCRARGAVAALPRVSAAPPRLRFHRAGAGDALTRGPFGLAEPDAAAPEIAVEAIDVMIVPGLAFDRAGRRLGWGGGYYDEAAGRLRAAGRGFLVGLGYDFQLVPRCPADERDVAVDCVVTDQQVIWCHREASS
jgi:5-formyltetrahydrofolate cyclo-ligase